MKLRKTSLGLTIAVAMPLLGGHAALAEESRFALVIGEDAYTEAPLPTAANDAGLVADTLREAGFEVIGQRNLDQPAMRNALKEFLNKVSQAGPDAVVAFYFSGYGLQYAGENYLVPYGAKIDRDTDVPLEAVRLDDFTRSLAAMQLKARIVMIDAARNTPYAKSGGALAGGLAMVDASDGTLISFNTAPGSVAPEDKEGAQYGAYAQSFGEAAHQGGAKLDQVFTQLRVRANSLSNGAIVPWHVSKITADFTFFAPENRAIAVEGADQAQAPAQPAAADVAATPAKRPIAPDQPVSAEMTIEEAYAVVVERDTIKDYETFLTVWPDEPLSKRVRVLLAARREAVTWQASRAKDTANAYWSYLKRYPKGAHAEDARRRLARLSASYDPPEYFEEIYYEVAPPPPVEIIYISRPVYVFYDPIYVLPPPPPVWVVPYPIWIAPKPIPIWSNVHTLPYYYSKPGFNQVNSGLNWKPPQYVKPPVAPGIITPMPLGQAIAPQVVDLANGKKGFQPGKFDPQKHQFDVMPGGPNAVKPGSEPPKPTVDPGKPGLPSLLPGKLDPSKTVLPGGAIVPGGNLPQKNVLQGQQDPKPQGGVIGGVAGGAVKPAGPPGASKDPIKLVPPGGKIPDPTPNGRPGPIGPIITKPLDVKPPLLETRPVKPIKPLTEPPIIKPLFKPQIQPEIRPNVQPQIRPQIQPQIRPQLQPEFKPQIHQDVRPNIRPQIQQEIKPQFRPQIQQQSKPQVQQVRPQTFDRQPQGGQPQIKKLPCGQPGLPACR